MKVPNAEPGQVPKAGKGDNMHPFWAITRLQKKDDEYICKMGRKATTVVVVAEAGPDEEKLGNTFKVYIPFIYNTVALAPDTRLAL